MSARVRKIRRLFKKWGLSKSKFAEISYLSISSFTNKINSSQPNIVFTDDELTNLESALKEMALDIQKNIQ
jgi:hypothetical protein